MTNQQQMIDPADVQALLEAYDYSDQSHSDRGDLINGLRDLLPKPDYPEDMLGMWAEHPEYGRVLVCNARPDRDGEVVIALRDDDRKRIGVLQVWVNPTTLSFSEQHPETLTTLEDYENAPEGTIVAEDEEAPFIQGDIGIWRAAGPCTECGEHGLSGTTRRVLRWGWGK